MKNLIKRLKNIYFWSGCISVILTALHSLHVNPSDLNTWDSVYQLVIKVGNNPFLLVTTIIALLGVTVDTSTKGLRDNKNVEDEIKKEVEEEMHKIQNRM